MRAYRPEEFWLFVKKGEGENDCWIWTGPQQDGSGIWKLARRAYCAHRYAYELVTGKAPEGNLSRTCMDIRCVNPAHMTRATCKERDRLAAIRRARGEVFPSDLKKPPQRAYRKLTWEDVVAIRQDASAGVSQRMLAKKYNVTQSNVNSIVHGATWREPPKV